MSLYLLTYTPGGEPNAKKIAPSAKFASATITRPSMVKSCPDDIGHWDNGRPDNGL
jgi:hypothetical protein